MTERTPLTKIIGYLYQSFRPRTRSLLCRLEHCLNARRVASTRNTLSKNRRREMIYCHFLEGKFSRLSLFNQSRSKTVSNLLCGKKRSELPPHRRSCRHQRIEPDPEQLRHFTFFFSSANPLGQHTTHLISFTLNISPSRFPSASTWIRAKSQDHPNHP
jgi:hypothetical protein